EYVFHPNINASGTPGVSRTTFNLQDRPELRIDMNRLISTGNLSVSNVNVYGGGAGISWRNLLVRANTSISARRNRSCRVSPLRVSTSMEVMSRQAGPLPDSQSATALATPPSPDRRSTIHSRSTSAALAHGNCPPAGASRI